MARKYQPGGCQCCCDLCNIWDTAFGSADSLDNFTISDINEVSWSSGSAKINANPGSFIKVLADETHPLVPYAPRLKMKVKGGDGSRIRLLISWSSNHQDGLIAELRPGTDCGQLYLIQMASGVETEKLGPIAVPKGVVDTWHEMIACYDPHTLAFRVIVYPHCDANDTTEVAVILDSHTDSEYAGFGTPDTSTADTYFDELDFDILWYCEGTATIETTQDGESEGIVTINELIKGGGGENEHQLIDIEADSGTFTLTFDGQTTSALNWNASNAQVETALEALSSIGSGNVSVTDYSEGWEVEFVGTLANTDVALMTGDASSLLQNTGQSEVQTLTVDAARGTYKLSFDGSQTASIDYDANAQTIEEALEDLSSIGEGNVSVSGSNPYTITFQGSLATTDLDEITANDSCLQDDESYYMADDCVIAYCHQCRGECGWAKGHFGVADDDKDCEWEYDITDWTIAGNAIKTSVSNSTILHKAEYPWNDRTGTFTAETGTPFSDWEFYHRHTLKMTFRADTADRVIYAIVAAADDENFIALELTVAYDTEEILGKARLIDVTGGVVSAISREHLFRGVTVGAYFTVGVDFNDGVVRAAIRTDATVPSTIGFPPASWQRELRSEADDNTYHGDQVGMATAGGTGEVKVSYFVAGCYVHNEFCALESDDYQYQSGDWKKDAWTKVSGTWPTQNGDGTISTTAPVKLLHRNPVLDQYEDNNRVTLKFGMSAVNVGDKFYILASHNDAGDAGLALGIDVLNSTNAFLRLCSVSGGVYTALRSSVAIPHSGYSDHEYILSLCVSTSSLHGHVQYSATGLALPVSKAIAIYDISTREHRFGLDIQTSTSLYAENIGLHRLGSINSGISSLASDCTDCQAECGLCADGAGTRTLLVELPTLATCASTSYCDPNSLTWYVDHRQPPTSQVSCCWDEVVDCDNPDVRPYQMVKANLTTSGVDVVLIVGYLTTGGTGRCWWSGFPPTHATWYEWQKVLTGDDLKCDEWDQLEVPFSSKHASCPSDPGSCYVTSV
jgi:hypothetical protein